MGTTPGCNVYWINICMEFLESDFGTIGLVWCKGHVILGVEASIDYLRADTIQYYQIVLSIGDSVEYRVYEMRKEYHWTLLCLLVNTFF